MAYSNTVSQTVFDTRKVIETAIRRCKLTAEQITSEYINIANNNLYLLLSDLANQGVPLWCVEKLIMPMYDGVVNVPLPTKVNDVLNANLRYLTEVTGTNTDTSTEREVEFDSATFITTVGVFWTAASVPLAFERSDDGVTWETVQTETPDAAAGEWTWYDLDSVVSSLYFRVRATSGTLSFDQIYLGNNPTEIPLARLSRDSYTNLPNKQFTGNQPLQYWFDRQIPQPQMYLWPVPNAAASVRQLTLWAHRYIMDVGAMTQQIEVPQRWYEAIVSMLAARMALEIPEVPVEMVPLLDGKAEKALYIAQLEERDNSPMMIQPNISMYTR